MDEYKNYFLIILSSLIFILYAVNELNEGKNENKMSAQPDYEFQNPNSPWKPTSALNVDSLFSLSSDLKAIYKQGNLSDVVLVSENLEIPAHKLILFARSPEFARMFTESTENRIIMSDVNQSVAEQLVLFIYTGQINELSYFTARDLYAAADKYAILELKAFCRQAIISLLSISTAIEALILADTHNDVEMKMDIMSYIFFNLKAIIVTEKWAVFLKEHPKLGTEVQSFIINNLI
ncbi:speckle-type POZ protein B-like [Stegodyphus dumicola]|uniref:speckle-type POZ protein B-like n=1 Tax=Stegodyphus dumicola TaxID=202533 RepID=UPI0015A943AF|nr:speckle-type POZ protein B-like [Stegodyphus dumicola]